MKFKGTPIATSTSPILNYVCPPVFCISIVLNFSWDMQLSQEKFKTMLLGGGGGGGGKQSLLWEMWKW